MGKKILILGNGFDLAHGLKTKYSNFLDLCNNTLGHNESEIPGIIMTMYSDRSPIFSDLVNKFMEKLPVFKECICNNIWYIYLKSLYEAANMRGENWIDFESEIRYIIETIDIYTEDMKNAYRTISSTIHRSNILNSNKFRIFNNCHIIVENWSIRKVRERLYHDLEDLIKAMEIYFLFIESIPIKLKSPDIANNYDYILNFNYTHTYKRVYDKNAISFHIHGELDKNPNNMVLGIDEYWSEEKRDMHTNFTIFKKFAQRIQKRTGIESYKWFKEINDEYRNYGTLSEIFIFGHSLDITDKDILYDFLESESTSVTIFCKDKETEGEYIAKVIRIISEKRLLEKVNQYPSKFQFVIQNKMESIEEKLSGAAT